MQPIVQLFFVTLNARTNNFEYETNSFVAPPVDPLKTVERLTTDAYPELGHRMIAETTTWHFDAPNKLNLVFMMYSDYFDFADATVLKLVPPKDGPWLALRPGAYDDMSLVSHALRHLSYHIIQQGPPKWMLASTIEKLAKLDKELAAEVLVNLPKEPPAK